MKKKYEGENDEKNNRKSKEKTKKNQIIGN